MPAPQVTPWMRPLRAFQHAVQDALGRRHLPQHVHVDAALAVGALMGDARLVDAAVDGVGDQLLMALAPGACRDRSGRSACRSRRRLSALTPEKVPTPPHAAQAPELSPLDTEMPLPPSTSGSTSRPEMTSGFSAFTYNPRSVTACRRPALAAATFAPEQYVLIAWPIIKPASRAVSASRSGRSLNTAATPQRKSSAARAGSLTV